MLIRSLLFYILLGLWTIFMGVVCIPYLIISKSYLRKPIKLWINILLKILRITCGISYEIIGLEKITKKTYIVASKHQSAFETFILFFHINNSIFIHKKQLFFIPIFGQYLKKINMISINRIKGPSAMRKVLKEAKLKINQGYSIIIFPEGTRKKPNEKADYKTGIAGIYAETNVEILPVAVNSGYCWPKHTFIKSPGKITIKILDSIPTNLDKKEVMLKIESKIENELKKL